MPILGLYDVNIYVDSKYIFSVTKQCEECSTKKKGARNIIFVFNQIFKLQFLQYKCQLHVGYYSSQASEKPLNIRANHEIMYPNITSKIE